jgi:hypothetical protein
MSHVTNRPPQSRGWTKNTWTDRAGVRMSQGQIVTADGSLGGRIVWVEVWSVCGWTDRQGIKIFSQIRLKRPCQKEKTDKFFNVGGATLCTYNYFMLCPLFPQQAVSSTHASDYMCAV